MAAASLVDHRSTPVGDIAVRCAGLTKWFDSTLAVDGIDVQVKPGGFLALLGPSGCGKSTTLRLIAGFEVPDAGTVTIGSQTVAGPRNFTPPERRHVGMVFQEGALFPHMTAADNIAYGISHQEDRASRVRALLELVGLPGMDDRMPHELSGGQQQRVALARALAPRPTVVLLDEPFSNLDAGLRARLRTEVRNILRQAGATAIFVTHDQDEAFSLADEVAVMWHGRVVQRSTPQDLYKSPSTRDVAAFVGEANFLPGRADGTKVETELGVLMANDAARGEVDVLVRPESIRLTPDEASDIVVGQMEYFGHDRMFSVDLRSSLRLKSRANGDSAIGLGTRVRIEVIGPVITFPRLALTE